MPRLLVPALAAATATLAAVSASAAVAAPATDSPAFHRYAREWDGHTRLLKIGQDHVATESVYDGCCDHVVDVTFRVSHAHGTLENGTMRARVTHVHVFDKTFRKDAPHVGDRAVIHVRNSVLHEPFTGTIYCTGKALKHAVCGA